MNPSDPFVAYAAGFFDGEGSIDIRYETRLAANGKTYERFYLRVCVVQVDRAPLDKLAAMWGGSVSKRSAGKCHTWAVTTASASAFLADVTPHLIVKRKEAELAIQFQATMRSGIKNTAGSKGVDRLSDEVRSRRFEIMHAIRHARLEKGVFARSRANVPAERLN